MKFKKLIMAFLFSLLLLTSCKPNNEFRTAYDYDTYDSFINALSNLSWEENYEKYFYVSNDISDIFIPIKYSIGGYVYSRNASKTTEEAPFMNIESVGFSYSISDESLEDDYPFHVGFYRDLPNIDIDNIPLESYNMEEVEFSGTRSLFDIYVTVDGQKEILCYFGSYELNTNSVSREQIENICNEFFESYINSIIKIRISPNVDV